MALDPASVHNLMGARTKIKIRSLLMYSARRSMTRNEYPTK
jgi:hypothetical protein